LLVDQEASGTRAGRPPAWPGKRQAAEDDAPPTRILGSEEAGQFAGLVYPAREDHAGLDEHWGRRGHWGSDAGEVNDTRSASPPS